MSAVAALNSDHWRTRIRISHSVNPIVPQLQINDTRYAIDLHDSSGHYCPASLSACDVYVKRSYTPDQVPPYAQIPVIPFGLSYACRSIRSVMALGRLLTMQPNLVRTLSFHNYLHLPRPQEYEYAPDRPADPVVLFQTRVWPEDQLGEGDTLENVNGARVALVRELRRAFGKRFVGGLIPTSNAISEFPDLVTKLPHRRRQYIKFSRRPLIAIYSRGLHGSYAFKMIEYLASSKCIVGEQLTHTLPVALEEGRHYATFCDIGHCVSLCDDLLSQPKKANEMRHANWQYYQEYVRCDRRIEVLVKQWDTLTANVRNTSFAGAVAQTSSKS